MLKGAPLPAGITKDNLSMVREYGFEGAAVLGSVWEAPNPEAAFLELQNACQSS